MPLQADKESIQRMSQFLQIRQQHKMQEFSETRRKALNTFHLPLWKRTFDVLFSLSALVILSPLLIGTAIAIRLESKGKVSLRALANEGFVDLPYADGYEVKELWTGHEAQVQDALSGYVPKHGVKLFRVKAAE